MSILHRLSKNREEGIRNEENCTKHIFHKELVDKKIKDIDKGYRSSLKKIHRRQ